MTFISGRYSWLNIQSSKHLTFYPTWRSNSRAIVQLVLHVSALDTSKGSLFMIYLRSTPTNQDPDKVNESPEFLIDLLFVNTTDIDITD